MGWGPVSSILVWSEQGLGDRIQFARFAPELAGRGIEVSLLCWPPLRRLLEHTGAQLIEAKSDVAIPRADAWTLFGSLPLRLGTRIEALPPPVPIRAEQRDSGGLGFVWRGSPRHPDDRNRSLPAELARQVMARPGVRSLAPEDTGARDFQDTAELVAGLDLVITVDTALAHLAGSMGKPTWVLLPAIKTDWRWGDAGASTSWYPSIRLIRQTTAGDWGSVIDGVLADLDSRPSQAK